MVATFGLLLVIQYVVFFMFGPSARSLQAPFDPTIQVAGLTFSGYRVLVSVASVVAILLLYLFLHRTRYGMWMRGVRQDPGMAAAVGIRTSVVYMLTFGLGSYLAALAGVLLAPIVGVHWQMGLDILAVAFIVVIVGGLGSLGGVFVVSHVYAVSENVASVFIQPLEARIFTLALMILIVLYRPEGIKTIIEEFRTS
jgi:branched-subunit amino acid ABC-type transport system permease component